MTFSSTQAVRWLTRATLLYLGVPVGLFFWGWFRVPLACGLSTALAWTIWRAGWKDGCSSSDTDLPNVDEDELFRVPIWALIFGAILPAAALVMLSGAGGWGSGDSDWFKHDTVLYDLIVRPWPVTYATSRGPILLVYYVTFYLPAALVGKWTGNWMAASQALAATMFIGILLSLAWLGLLGVRSGRRRTARWCWACLLFFGFSGMDVLGKSVVNLCFRLPASHGDWSDIEWWAQGFQYSSNAAALFWAPQHALGAWLATALVLAHVLKPARIGSMPGIAALPVSLALFWSPFAAVGLAPIVGLLVCFTHFGAGRPRGWRAKLLSLRTPANAFALMMVLAAVSYFATRSAVFAVPPVADIAPGRAPMPIMEGGIGRWIAVYAGFVLVEFGVLVVALSASFVPARCDSKALSTERLLLLIATAMLMLLPALHYGYANDLVMRGSLPALWVLQVLVLRRFTSEAGVEPPKRRWPRRLCAAVTIVGLLNAALEYRRHLDRMWSNGSWRDVERDEYLADRAGKPPPVFSLFQLQRTLYNRPGFDFARQYLGSPDTFYGRHLAPRQQPPPQPVAE